MIGRRIAWSSFSNDKNHLVCLLATMAWVIGVAGIRVDGDSW